MRSHILLTVPLAAIGQSSTAERDHRFLSPIFHGFEPRLPEYSLADLAPASTSRGARGSLYVCEKNDMPTKCPYTWKRGGLRPHLHFIPPDERPHAAKMHGSHDAEGKSQTEGFFSPSEVARFVCREAERYKIAITPRRNFSRFLRQTLFLPPPFRVLLHMTLCPAPGFPSNDADNGPIRLLPSFRVLDQTS